MAAPQIGDRLKVLPGKTLSGKSGDELFNEGDHGVVTLVEGTRLTIRWERTEKASFLDTTIWSLWANVADKSPQVGDRVKGVAEHGQLSKEGDSGVVIEVGKDNDKVVIAWERTGKAGFYHLSIWPTYMEIVSRAPATKTKTKGKDSETPKNALKPELAKKPKEEELQSIKEAFNKFDKDGSGAIDLRELKSMCQTLGKKLSDEEAAAAMQQMDQNGNMQCNFDEFLLWYTSKPGLGGHDNVALAFMKARLKMEGGLRRIKKRARAKMGSTDEVTFKTVVDASPTLGSSAREACSATISMTTAGEAGKSNPRFTLQLGAKDTESATRIAKLIQDLIDDELTWTPPDEWKLSIRPEANKILISIEDSDVDVADQIDESGVGILVETLKKIDGKVSLGVNFQDILENADKPLVTHFQGGKGKADVTIGLTALYSFIAKEGMPPEMEAALKVVAALVQDVRLYYDSNSLTRLTHALKKFAKGNSSWTTQLQLLRVAKGSLADARALLYQRIIKEGTISNGKYTESYTEKPTAKKIIKLINEMAAGLTGIDSLVLDRIPGSDKQFTLTFDQVNPFPLGSYLVGSYPKDPAGSAEFQKPQSDADASRLKETFDKYDKDKSGTIDLSELKDMLADLAPAAKLSDQEVKGIMEELDVNSDGTCHFDEFTKFWSSKPKLGGYNDVTVGLMKTKSFAGSKIAKRLQKIVARGKSRDSVAAPGHDTTIKFTSELTPEMGEVQDKMSVVFALDEVDAKAEGPPRAMLKLGAKSAEAADGIVAKIQEALNGVEQLEEIIGSKVVVARVDDKFVEVSVAIGGDQAETEKALVGHFLGGDQEAIGDIMRTIVALAKAFKLSNAKMVWANDFDDFLAAPDKPMLEVFKGGKAYVELNASAQGKKLFLDSLPLFDTVDALGNGSVELAQELAKVFLGADITHVVGFRPDNVASSLKVNEMAEQLSKPVGLKEALPGLMKISGVKQALKEIASDASDQPAVFKTIQEAPNTLEYLIQRLDSVESISFTNVDLPQKYSPNDLPGTMGATLTFNNVRPFGLMEFLTPPTLAVVRHVLTKAAEADSDEE